MEELKRFLAQDDTVLFVGSGISLWSGLPSWPRLIEALAQFVEASGANADIVRAEAQRGDLLQAASYGFYKLTKHQIGDFIRKACQYGVAKPHQIHRKLVSLGPRCFVTTNYDNLIEESLRLWQPDRFYRSPVTNRHLTETADIVHARAIDFVFKPHGDAGDSDSIILTREQYRQLLPGGERQAALESVKMLLASRPVVYIGFGLRDPDFIYVRDLLSNTYKGGIRDHYAIMADICDAEVDYWRINYGIHLVGYTTALRADGSRDHSALLKVLDDLLSTVPPIRSPASAAIIERCSPDTILALARHAARLTRAPKCDPEFPIRVHSERIGRERQRSNFEPDEFDHCPVERFLDAGPTRAILIGLPGSGKSYSLQRAAARLGEKLHEICLSEVFDQERAVIPLLADLKLYRGDLYGLVNETLPNGLSLDDLGRRHKVKIFLDSFNEMPREFWETGSYEADFAKFIADHPDASFIIGARTNDGLSKLEFPSYRLDQIDGEFVGAELKRLGIDVGGRFHREVRSILQKPFYFQLIASGTVSLAKEAHPKVLYQMLFRGLITSFQERFSQRFNLEYALSLAAYEAINRGEEAQPLANVLEIFRTELEGAGLGEIQASNVANWLVSKSVLIPYRGARIAFFHQSTTEYLAACELARRYQRNPHVLKEKLNLRRWDQALFLTLSVLPPADTAPFIQTVAESDLALALNATKYLEFDRDEVVAKLLSEIPPRIESLGPFERQIESAVLFGMELSDVHEPQLRELMKCGDAIGAAAVTRLVELKGASVKDELLQSLLEARDDYNYCCNGVASALKPFATSDDVQKIIALADSIQDQIPRNADDHVAHGFTSGAAAFLSGLDVPVVREGFLPKEKSEQLSEIRARILCGFLQEKHSTDALELAGELLIRSINKAATAIFFISHFAKPDDRLSSVTFSSEHVDRLVSMLNGKENESWSVKALRCICDARPDLTELVVAHASKSFGILKAALLYCASGETAPVFAALTELAEMGIKKRGEGTHLLKQIELDWAGHETLFFQLLRLRDMGLVRVLVPEAYESQISSEFDLGQIDWWLDWLMEERGSESGFWFIYQMAGLFAKARGARSAFVAEFNKQGSRYRSVLAYSVLPRFPDLTTDAFSEDAISFLLADLNRPGAAGGLHGHLLGGTATEQFVTERLLPLIPDTKPPFSENLQKVLRQAGSRHGRRYVVL
jgi:hypothetical protein